MRYRNYSCTGVLCTSSKSFSEIRSETFENKLIENWKISNLNTFVQCSVSENVVYFAILYHFVLESIGTDFAKTLRTHPENTLSGVLSILHAGIIDPGNLAADIGCSWKRVLPSLSKNQWFWAQSRVFVVVVRLLNLLCHRFWRALLVKRVHTDIVSEFRVETR